MRRIFKRVLKSLNKLNPERLRVLVRDLVVYNEHLEMVLSSIPGGVVVIGQNNRIWMLNNPARRLLPLLYSDPVGKKAWEVLALQELANYVKTALEEDRGASMRDFSVRSKGGSITLSCGVLTLVDRGKIKGSMLYVEDVTEVRAEEARLKRAEGLASLTTMAAGVAHETKNPLASMGIHIQLIRRKIETGNVRPDEFYDTLEILEEEVERLNNIVSDYLFTVRPITPNPRLADINAIITDLLQFLRFEVEKNEVHVILLLDDTIPAIPLDESAMKRVLLNLVKNALAAMPDGGEIRFETRLENENICITIADTGHGIPASIQGKVFEPYFTTRDTGSGLGLSVVYKVIKEHGGDLQMDSVKGRGTKFHITIPVPQSERKLLIGGST